MLGSSMRAGSSRGFPGSSVASRAAGESAASNADGMVPPLSPASSSTAGVGSSAPVAQFGVSTLCNVGKSSENQDSFVASSNSSGSKCLVGVFDGHGQQGHRISQFAKDQISKSLFNSKDLYSNPASALEGAYFDAQRLIEKNHSDTAYHSGTTAVAAYQHRDKLIVANVGDSRAVLGQLSDDTAGGMKAIELSSDQRPGRQDERKRILSAGGVVQQSQYPMRATMGGPARLMRVGPERVWDRTGCCGLGVTRSLGDLAMHPFVVANPEVHERIIEANDKLLILGSDGVWDRLESQEAVDIAARHPTDPTAAAKEITEICRHRWHQRTQGRVSDDITAVVVYLEHNSSALPGDPPASMNRVVSSRRATADSTDRNLHRLASSLGSVIERPSSETAALRLSRVPRRRGEAGGTRSRKAPLHNWKGPKD